MLFGKLVKPDEGKKWLDAEPIPNFCNDYRFEVHDYNDCKIRIEEFSWTFEKSGLIRQDNSLLLCTLTVPSYYRIDLEGYEDAELKEHDRFCIEELGFKELEIDEGDWIGLVQLCTFKDADIIMSRISKKRKELNYDHELNETGRFFRYEQVKCPRCEHICLIGEFYCTVCGLVVNEEAWIYDWESVPYDTSKAVQVKKTTDICKN